MGSPDFVLAVEGVLIGVAGAAGATGLETAFTWAGYATVVAVPLAFVVGLARSHLYRMGAVAGLVERLGGRIGSADLRDALAQALDDPALTLAFWLPDERRYVDADGRPVELPAPGSGRAATPIRRAGEPVAALVHDAALAEPELVAGVGAAATLALENERLEAEAALISPSSDGPRRGCCRPPTPSAAASSATCTTARSSASSPSAAARHRRVAPGDDARLGRPARRPRPRGAARGLKELRELARGIHPALLTDQGLDAALAASRPARPSP